MTVDAIMLNRDTPRAAGLKSASVCRNDADTSRALTHAKTLIANFSPVIIHVAKFQICHETERRKAARTRIKRESLVEMGSQFGGRYRFRRVE